jgi:26S proteasome regulatory subunit N1
VSSICCTGVRNESDPALALLTDFIENKAVIVRTASVCGLGIAYAGSKRAELMELLVPGNNDTSN